MPPAAIGDTPPMPHTRLTSTRAPRPHGAPHGQPAARSKALAPLEGLAEDSRANEHDAVKARGPMPPAAIGTTPPMPHIRLISTRASRPHGTPHGQPAARSEALVPLEALAEDSRAKKHDAVKARGAHAPHRQSATRPPRPTPASGRHAHLGPMALHRGNQQPAPKPVYSRVRGSKAVTLVSPQLVARRGNNPGAVAVRMRTRAPTPNTGLRKSPRRS